MRVELSDVLGMPLGSMVTDQSGEAHFNSLSEGNYQVLVSGGAIEDTSFSFPLYHREGRSLQIVQVKPKRAADGTPLASATTVSSADLKVPRKALAEFKRGTEALTKQDWEEARKRLEKAIELYPNYVGAYNNLGIVFVNSGKVQKGRAAFERAVAINSNYAPGYVNLARVASSEGKYQEAEDQLKKSVRLNPQNVEALFMLAQIELLNRNYGDAIHDARAVHSLPHHDYAQAHYVCAVALQANGRIEEASQEYKTFLEEHPEGADAEQVRQLLQSLEQPSR